MQRRTERERLRFLYSVLAVICLMGLSVAAEEPCDDMSTVAQFVSQQGLLLAAITVPPNSALDDQAMAAATQFWSRRYTRCGSSFYSGNYLVAGESRQFLGIIEYKDFKWIVVAQPLSEADRLNGLEWKGRTELRFTAYRWRPTGHGWAEWLTHENRSYDSASPGGGMYPKSPGIEDGFTFLEKRNGVWNAAPLMQETRGAVSCSDVGTAQSAQVQPNPENRKLPDVEEGAPTRTFARASSVLKPQGGSRYDANNVLDGRLDTAWVEGVPGPGRGEWIEIEFPVNTVVSEIAIFPGYGKSEQLFKKNSRPRKILIQFVGEYQHSGNPRAQEMALVDEMKWQTVKVTPSVTTVAVRFTIIDVYPGTAYEDTAISEIRIR